MVPKGGVNAYLMGSEGKKRNGPIEGHQPVGGKYVKQEERVYPSEEGGARREPAFTQMPVTLGKD